MTTTATEDGTLTPMMDRSDWRPMNDIQRMIADYLSDNPGESYASIARRGGMPRSTVFALAKRPVHRQTPNAVTIQRLAKGLGYTEARVRAAAAHAAGFTGNATPQQQEFTTQQGRLLAEAMNELDEERLEALARRARHLLAEMREEQADSGG